MIDKTGILRGGINMKKYKIVYWFGSCVTECYVNASNEQEALEKFKKQKGEKRITSVEVCE